MAITYDANGNMIYDGNNQTFEWDEANRLVAINYLDSGNRTEFAYDGLGRMRAMGVIGVEDVGPDTDFTMVVQPSTPTPPLEPSYASYSSGPLSLLGGDYVLSFEGLNPNGGDNTAFIDAVKLNDLLVPNGSFETPNVGDANNFDSYQYNPTNGTWTFSPSSGISGNGGGFTSGNPDAPDQDQVGLISIQRLNFANAKLDCRYYTLAFQAAQRGNVQNSFQSFRVHLMPLYPPGVVLGVISGKTFVWSGNTIAEERDSTGSTTTKRFFAEGEQRIGGSDAGSYYYSRDHLGSIREVTDSTGALKSQFDYDAWGNSVVVSGNMNVDFGFTGHYFHAPSGMNLTRTRVYNPTLARWISRDWIAEAGGINLYGYVVNDPLNKYDPFGLQQPEEDTPDPLMGGDGTLRGQNQIQDIGNFASQGATTIAYPDSGKGFFEPASILCKIKDALRWLIFGGEILDKYNLKCEPPNNSCSKNAKDDK